MSSFRISVTPHRRAAARFINMVHRKLQKAYSDAPEVSQTDIANALGVHRSVINRQLRGTADISLGRVAELAYLLGLEADFDLVKPFHADGCNVPRPVDPLFKVKSGANSYFVSESQPQKQTAGVM